MHLKMLGLPADWSASLTLERYIQHAKLKQHFLVCPVCGPPAGVSTASSIAAASHAAEPPGNQDTPGRGPAAIGAAMNTSTACKKPLPSKLPGGRVTKLFLPLCTPREWEDAQRLLKRYAELFPGRTLRCRQCLGLRYGELKGLK